MSKELRVHNSAAAVQGIGIVPAPVRISDFKGVPDPLAVGANQNVNTLAEKPASSIPSVFARMIFFRMAFGGIEPSQYILQPNDPVSVYNRAISQCFDLLEIVFNKQKGLKAFRFDFDLQIQALEQDGNPKHRDFAQTLQQQKAKFLRGVDFIYLFYLDDELMGGTSKYSMVFTSPNWNSGRPVRSLLERDPEFRLFVYKYARAYNRSTQWGQYENEDEYEFYQYIKNCFHSEGPDVQNAIPASYSIVDLERDFPRLEIEVTNMHRNEIISSHRYGNNNGLLFLYSRPKNQFTSDFFIKSTIHPIIDQNTPLVLAKGQYHGMRYYDQVMWRSTTDVQQNEHDPNHPEEKNELPDCDAYTHPYLTEIDFLEENLLALPFEINTEEYYGGISLDEDYSAMIPVKPIFYQYFTRKDLDQMMTWNQKTKELVLSIPVCNLQGQQTGTVEFKKRYTDTNTCYLTVKGIKSSLSLGIFPLIKASAPIKNDYWIMLGLANASNYNKAKLNFFNIGSEKKLEFHDLERHDTVSKTWYQNVNDFDYVQIELPETDKTHQKVRAIVVPKFETHPVNNGAGQCKYAIDFGTTNTHIAYRVGKGDAISFDKNEIRQQVAYLNKKGNTELEELELLQARWFIPRSEDGKGNYTFPIRTVVNSNDLVKGDEQSVLFTKTSIGFHYPNERVFSDEDGCHYQTELKWKYLSSNDGLVEKNAEAFFEELMRMIKTHWLLQKVDHSRSPQFVLTYPLAGKGGLPMIRDGWANAYNKVFGENIVGNNIPSLPESLAPCVNLILGPNAQRTSGVLNIDIGGGSTDIQYYKEPGPLSYYDSIKFAGDDLWGIGNENISEYKERPKRVKQNHFTTLADKKFDNCFLVIGGNSVEYAKVEHDDCKEKINYLLRDEKHHFANLLGKYDDPDTRICRLHLFLHYSAILYHVAKWMKSYDMPIPTTVSFSGLGSLYVKMLFATRSSLESYTKLLIREYYGSSVPNGFSILFEENPKNVTAEGATMDINVIEKDTRQATYYGYVGNVSVLSKDIAYKKKDTIDSFKVFLDGFEVCSKAAGNEVPSLSIDELENLKTWAETSFEEIANAHIKKHSNNHTDTLQESAFIWTLKDSLWRL